MGTDKGLRFKTARGRGGMVENIYCRNIFMKDIVGEAIYFDMYYFTKPPKPGEKVEVPAVTEATPQFQNFYIDHIICNGAEKGIFVRGLPEMSIKNINLSDIFLQANKAVDIVEAENINLKNVTVKVKNAPMVYVENSTNISFEKFGFNDNSPLVLNISGERSKQIVMTLNGRSTEDVKPVFVNGAMASILNFKK
jgi:polygalacturonase